MKLSLPFSRSHAGSPAAGPDGRRGRLVAAYLALFVVSFALFFCAFYAWGRLEGALARAMHQAEARGVLIQGVRLTGPLPSLAVDSVQIPAGGRLLTLSRLRADLHLLDRSLEIRGECCAGTFVLRLTPERLTAPLPAGLELAVKDLSLPLLPLPDKSAGLVGLDGGILQAEGRFRLEAGQRRDVLPVRCTGELACELEDGRLSCALPVLKTPAIRGIMGQGRLDVAGNALVLRSLDLRGGEMHLHMDGRMELKQALPQSQIDFRGVLQAPVTLFEEGLLPRRTLAQLQQQGAVHFVLTRTLQKPSVGLQER